jgi:nitrilase
MRKNITVAGLQYAHQPGQRQSNLERAQELILAHSGHDIYVLPELASSGYGIEAFQQLDRLAETERGPSFSFFSRLAVQQECFICYSFPRRHESGKYTISAAVVNDGGKLVCLYDKMHVCQFGDCTEKDFFAAGARPAGVFDIQGVKVGVSICYDIRFPELTRYLVLKEQIVLLLHLGGWPRDAAFYTWHTFVTTRAMENGIYIMSTNRAGDYNGCSIFCPPFVDNQVKPTSLGSAEGVLVGKIDLSTLEEIRSTYPFLQDRRPELYDK